MAQFHHRHAEEKQEADYPVQSLFQTSGLPTTREETLPSSSATLNEALNKPKTWVRGYGNIVTT